MTPRYKPYGLGADRGRLAKLRSGSPTAPGIPHPHGRQYILGWNRATQTTKTMLPFTEEMLRASFSHRTDRQIERFWLCPPDDSIGIGLPLHFAKTGFSLWRQSVFMERENYTSLGIEVVSAGNAIYKCSGRTYTVGPGSAFLKLPGHGHRYETGPAGFLHKRFINMHGACLGNWVQMVGLGECPVVDHVDVRWFIERQRETAAMVAARDTMFVISLAAVMYRVLLQFGVWANASQWPTGLREAVEFMQRNIRRVLTVEEVARNAKLSVPSLCRAFSKQFDSSPQKYFRTMKMHLAANMLQHTAMPIKNIAFDLGYDNPFAFSTQFHKTMGTPPRQYRLETLPEYEKAEKT